MQKRQWLLWIGVPALIFFSILLYLLLSGRQQAKAVEQQVVRFHVVAHSDTPEDQELKLKVRNGVFALLKELFSSCGSQAEALSVAKAHRGELEEAAQRILEENGSSASVELQVGERFFPTKTYGSLSFPAGSYQAVSLRIGEAKGQNFWCVLYPALCLSPAVAAEEAEAEMAVAIGEKGLSFLKKADEKQKIRFALVEWFEIFIEKYLKS